MRPPLRSWSDFMPLDDQHRLALLGERAAGLVHDDMLVGLGTGSTATAMIDALGVRLGDGLRFTAVPTSQATFEQASALGIPMADLNDIDRLDICIDGADEIDPALAVVKGRGGALLFEKLVARRADLYVIIATGEKLVENLGARMPLPVEVVPEGWPHTAEEIAQIGLNPVLRKRSDNTPYRTDGGHFILDCAWPGENSVDPGSLAQTLKLMTGVVEHGLFIDMVDLALTIDPDGQITEHAR
jgi:ribose 5-phosphate isomerase A